MKKKIKILVMGLPGSGKTTLSDKLAPLIKASRVNADEVRKKFNDWDFSLEGRIRQSNRMNELSDQEIKKNKNVVTDFVCPTKDARKKFNADYIIWMNTIKQGRFEDTNKMFQIPESREINFEVKEKNAEIIKNLILNDLKSKFDI
tara:strand:- start:568 stop:1005 length:438 start_codon:yes stop_codon:yes gene_type:complete